MTWFDSVLLHLAFWTATAGFDLTGYAAITVTCWRLCHIGHRTITGPVVATFIIRRDTLVGCILSGNIRALPWKHTGDTDG